MAWRWQSRTCARTRQRLGRALNWVVKWLKFVNEHANTIANFLNDCVGARQVVHKHQKVIYRRVHVVAVSVPTRFATNLFVMKSVLNTQAALKAAVADAALDLLPPDSKADDVQAIVEHSQLRTFSSDLKLAVELLQPFSDMLHQIEGDHPALGRCFVGLEQLDERVRACVDKHKEQPAHISDAADLLLKPRERRYLNKGQEGAARVQKLFNPVYALTYLLDSLYADVNGPRPKLPKVGSVGDTDFEEEAKQAARLIGGEAAVTQLVQLLTTGWPPSCKDAVIACNVSNEVPRPGGGTKRRRAVPDLAMRKGAWSRYGSESMPELTKVTMRLLCCHPTSRAAERNWSLWAKVLVAARSALALERGRKLIQFCFNCRAKSPHLCEYALTLAVVEGPDAVEGGPGAEADGPESVALTSIV